MTRRDDVLATLRQMKPHLREKYHIEQLWLFGSVARGDDRPESDVDLLYQFHKPLGWEIVDLGDELETALGCKVDLVSRKFVRPRFWSRIEEDLLDV